MKELIRGLGKFRSTYVSSHRDLMEHLSQGQKPKVLFITCSDSRLAPNLITQSDLGELFVIRNAGNIIPPYGAANGGEGAAVEYAIHALGIEQIIVCGHSHCGAMKGLLKLSTLEEEMPQVYNWLKHAEATRRLVNENYRDTFSNEELLEITIAENVLTQIENLRTYPVVHSRLYQGKLQIYGWVYHIETGEVLAYDPMTHSYVPPQTQLALHDLNGKSLPKQFITTNAPPVACELPPPLDSEQLAPVQLTHSATVSTESTNNGASHSLGATWLSPEQAERIYRGSAARNP
ncbi:carbonic anhydrase [Leptolyngbya sp. FACHB-36]|uniref:carbonic anhydrase n=1 Tax=Leptolyngbya sp. FACHB-36 TaxID=2692808 RepID=UPI00168150D1|nr:carbonic anhydrase [Leptolyngbya sp. FACHB-36]MBD2019896.1 carbonic anhydrase [Leptolyngbya sp. FACHB-36]